MFLQQISLKHYSLSHPYYLSLVEYDLFRHIFMLNAFVFLRDNMGEREYHYLLTTLK
jgi:hypothetical protein